MEDEKGGFRRLRRASIPFRGHGNVRRRLLRKEWEGERL